MIARDALSVLTDSHSVTHSHPVTRAGGGARRGVFTFLPCKILVDSFFGGINILFAKKESGIKYMDQGAWKHS